MRAVVQRVSRAAVLVAGEPVGSIDAGFLVLLGVATEDTSEDASAIASKIAGLRVFADEDGRMNRDVSEAGGSILLVSQFTLLADVRRGRRPSFGAAAAPEQAAVLLDEVTKDLEMAGIEVASGRFGAHMEVELVNDGPVTILLESSEGRIR